MNIKIINKLVETKSIKAQVMAHKGVNEDWFHSTNLKYNSGAQMHNFEKGKEMLLRNCKESKKGIGILVDKDNDGFTSSAIMYNWLKIFAPELDIKLYMAEGKVHGIYPNFYDNDLNIDLLIIPDAGSSEAEEHKKINEMGIDILVLDHHEMLVDETEYAVIINPHNKNCSYPNKDLSGAGVVFKFLQAIDEELEQDIATQFVDLAAVGIIGDVMLMKGLENKAIANYGLSKITNPFLVALCGAHQKIQGIDNVTPFKVAWYITPIINAVIRVGTLEDQLDMIKAMTGQAIPQLVIAQMLKLKASQDRKKEPIFLKIVHDTKKKGRDENAIIFANSPSNMPSSMTGLIAGQLTSQYQRPVILGKVNQNGDFVGSARSIQGSSIENFKDFCEESGFFNWVAGHQSAHGLSIPENKIEDFLIYAANNLPTFERTYEVDYSLQDLDKAKIVFELSKLSPHYCKGFEEILLFDTFLIKGANIRVVGQKNDTIIFNTPEMEYIAFRQKNLVIPSPNDVIKVTVIGKPSVNEWNGTVKAQIIMEDFRIDYNVL